MDYDINFFSEDVDFNIENPSQVMAWIFGIIKEYGQELGEINFIFCSDEYLLEINQRHLNHDTYTDIITFPLHENGLPIMADIFISIERVKENGSSHGASFIDELHRVMAHGVLHMLGEDDKDSDRKEDMRKAEDRVLALRSF